MTRLKKNLCFLPLLLLAACSQHTTEENYSLLNQYTKGETYNIAMQMDNKLSFTDSSGSTQQHEMKMENVVHYEVKDLDPNGVASIAGTYVSMKMNGFDSKDSSTYGDTLMLKLYRLFAQKEIILHIDSLGNVKSVTGADGLYNRGIKNSPLNDNEIMRESVQHSTGIFPGKKVKIGDSWQRTDVMQYDYPGIYKSTYTLKSVKDGMATIDLKTDITPNLKAPPAYFPGNVIAHMELYGSENGTIWVDVTRGKIIKTESTLQISGKVRGARDGKAFENVLSNEMTTKIQVTLETK